MLIAYQKLAELTGFSTYDSFRNAHKELVNESLAADNKSRQSQWTESIAVGSKSFVETIKNQLSIHAKGRKILEKDEDFQLREEMPAYNGVFDGQKDDIGAKNTYFWNIL